MFSVLLIIMKEKLSQTDSGQNDNRFYSETIAIREKRLQNQTELSSEYSRQKKKVEIYGHCTEYGLGNSNRRQDVQGGNSYSIGLMRLF